MGAKSNAPEITTAPITVGEEYYKDCVYLFKNGALTKDPNNSESGPRSFCFIPIENSNDRPDSKFIRGYLVTGDMLFECTSNNTPSSYSLGECYSFAGGDDEDIFGVIAVSGTDLYVVGSNPNSKSVMQVIFNV
jgi:hypothetical protein